MRVFRCRCRQPLFFGNTQCLHCGAALGYDPAQGALLPLAPADGDGLWRADTASAPPGSWRRCEHLGTASGCNWLVATDDDSAACRCCRLLRTLPDLSAPQHALWFNAIEQARRRLVAHLIALGLPLRSRNDDPTVPGLTFDVLASPPQGPAVVTGHADGLITLDLHEADDATREARRAALGEPYRTLLGHLRHESGHYYWQCLIEADAALLDAWRERFGDERAPYDAALAAYYASGPAVDWAQHHVSAYASAHPWEDWAESWAHYLHFADTLDTARALGLSGEQVAVEFEPFDAAALDGDPAQARAFSKQLKGWMELAGALNELCRSMGVADFYPFVLSLGAARKLWFVHRMVSSLA
jgi:hypothetical protein